MKRRNKLWRTVLMEYHNRSGSALCTLIELVRFVTLNAIYTSLKLEKSRVWMNMDLMDHIATPNSDERRVKKKIEM
ncbi:hypothetical protein MTR_4g017590 [Medicago truncatula]|uniref:Uncharacterized protein n=1 Tax=Medicago truncatula TaxID=3880 RepID=G7JQ89_MEDTR|nr:hypothetical protein MTR_4g017590 [Medicago truncatula]